jgi:hypothetical protein
MGRADSETRHLSDEEEQEDRGLLAPEAEKTGSLYGGSSGSADPAGYVSGTLYSELRQLFPLAWQTVLATVLQAMTQQVTVLFVGHIGVTELGAAALATMCECDPPLLALSLTLTGRSLQG